MADIWADFPSGSHGIYGDDETAMLDGVYAKADHSLANDPDPNVGAAGRVLKLATGSGVHENTFTFPTARDTAGIAARVWFDSLPTSEASLSQRVRVGEWQDAGGDTIGYVYIDTGGKISFVNGSSSSAAPTYTSDGPVVTASGWWHVESKLVCDTGGSGSIEVRVNGSPKIAETGLTTSAADAAAGTISTHADIGHTNPQAYIKDLVFWDGSSDRDNDFHGSVSAYWCPVASTNDIGGWTKSKGTDAVPLLDDAAPHNTLTCAGAISADETVRIDGTYYKFTSGSVDTGTPAGTSGAPWLVALGDDDAGSLANLSKAINADGTAGTDYTTALTAHATVVCRGLNETKLSVASQDGATTSMTFAETGAHLSWASTTALSYGPDDTSFISADSTPPDAAEFTLTGLPDDITSVRAIIPVVRAAKVDGGDGSLQLSLSPNGTDYDTGPDTPITTAFTYWGNATAPFVSDENPATSAAWTPSDFVTGVRLKIDRTV